MRKLVDTDIRPDFHKKAYADLAHDAHQVDRPRPRVDPAHPPTRAGLPLNSKPNGSGSFVLQTDWSMAAPDLYGATLSGVSESRRCFKAHDYRKEPAKAPYRGQGLPKGTDGNSFLSQSRQDFSREAIEGAVPYKRVQKIDFEARVREQNIRSQLTGRNRDAKVPQGDALLEYGYRELSTTSGLEFSAKAGPRNVNEQRSGACGRPTTRPRVYNIITGGLPLGNNRFERFEMVRDYRRTGPPIAASGEEVA